MSQVFVVVDYETRSEADLKAIGGYEYSTHSSTEVMCVAWRVGTKETLRTTPTYVWSPLLGDDIDAYKMLDKLIADLLNPGHMLVAHNAFFEQVITRNVLSRYIDGVKTTHRCDRAIRNIDHDRWICTAARAAALALPRNLEGACLALNLPIQKDMDGRRLLLKMCKPRKPTKNNPAKWHDTPADVARLIEYCRTDIAAEVEVFLNTPPLNETERAVWALDQKINFRGVFIDRHLVAETLKMIEVESTNMSEELTRITRGAVDKVTQRDRLLRYLHSLGARLPDLTAETVRDAIKSGEYAGDVLRLLEIKRDFGKTSTAKYSAFWFRSATDKRVRDSLLYHGASTGRWCIPPESLVLTPKGWVRVDSSREIKLAQVSLDGGISFKRCTVHSFDFSGHLLTANNRNISVEVTPEHTLPYITSRGTRSGRSAEECFGARADLLCSPFTYSSKFRPAIETRIIVMTQADGHFTDPSGGRYLRFRFTKLRKTRRCEALLRLAKIPYKKRVYTDATTLIVLLSKAPKWLAKDKKQFSFDQKHNPEVFIDELKKWDSHAPLNTSFEYSTCSERNAEFAQTMAHLSGRCARIVVKRLKGKGWSDCYRVYIRDSYKTRISPKDWGQKEYTGKVYCPTTETGFFLVKQNGLISVTGNSGSGVQFQNLPRGSIKDTGLSCKLVKEGCLDTVKMVYGNAMDVFSSNIRGCVIATPGKELFCADYAAIEARVLFWVAEYEAGCKMFADGIDLYKDMATKIYGVSLDKVTSKQRQLGKAAILGCGYGLGPAKFGETTKAQGITLEGELVKYLTPKGIVMVPELAVTIVNAYRETHHQVPALWRKLESAAKFAINNPGKVVKICRTKWFVKNHFLWCELPSGRRLAYYKPKIVVTTEKKKGELWKKESIEHYGLNNTTKQWEPQRTWGGTLTENVVQAIARDFMADAMLRIEASGYEVILSIHDELVAERKVGEGNLKEYEELMSTVPPWGNGCPIKVEGWSAKRYRK